jgi:glycosyltransferase involved in cell wall biosynthesis
MRLTVAIPTYNRNAVLRATLKQLLPQLDERCSLLILDNHSDVPVEQTLHDLPARYPKLNHRIVRNRANVGSAANILRCYELCETPWMWLFGDDDYPTVDAVEVILRKLDAHPHCLFFNFTSGRFSRERSALTTGLREFVFQLDYWSLLLFMSVGVYHCPSVVPALRFGHHFAYSLAPHVALVLASLGERGACCLAHEPIVRHQGQAEWSLASALLGKMTLLDLPMDDDVRRELARKLRQWPSLEATAAMLVRSAHATGRSREAVYQYDQICSRVYYGARDPATWLRIAAYRVLVRFARITYPLLTSLSPRIRAFSAAPWDLHHQALRTP